MWQLQSQNPPSSSCFSAFKQETINKGILGLTDLSAGEKKQLFCTSVIIALYLSILSNIKAVSEFMPHFSRDRFPTIKETSAFPQEKSL